MTALVTAFTLLSLCVVVITRLRLRGTRSIWLAVHTGFGVVGTVLWLVFLAAPSTSRLGGSLVGALGLGCWWAVSVAGIALMVSQASGGGRRSARTPSAAGRVLAVLVHLGVLAMWLVATWAYATRKV